MRPASSYPLTEIADAIFKLNSTLQRYGLSPISAIVLGDPDDKDVMLSMRDIHSQFIDVNPSKSRAFMTLNGTHIFSQLDLGALKTLI
jgi:hypothetical protein